MQSVLHWLSLGVVLVVTFGLGVCAHELLHLVPLALTDTPYTVTVLPSEDSATLSPTTWTTLQHLFTGSLVRVEVTRVPPTTPEWVVRMAAILPVLLALPLGLFAAGVLPESLVLGNDAALVALVAVTGCGLPSPADWSVVWYGSALCED